jgi:hypothetical protein
MRPAGRHGGQDTTLVNIAAASRGSRFAVVANISGAHGEAQLARGSPAAQNTRTKLRGARLRRRQRVSALM